MKNTLKILTLGFLLGLAACAKPTTQDQQAPASTNTPAPESKTVDMDVVVCQEISENYDKDYAIKTKSNIFVLHEAILYLVNQETGSLDKVNDGSVTMDGVCKFSIQSGAVSKVEVVQTQTAPSCGGPFQSPCAPQQHQPYVCGPNGQMCY
jgi:hypothetical protein